MSLTVVYILVAILLFGLLVLVHEFGHFLTAKLSGVQVNEFSLFMGPAIWKKQKGETLYSLRCIPIGGYCAMEGEDGDSDNPRAFGRAKVWKRLLILVAGSFMNLVAGLLIMTIYVASVYQAIPTRAVASVDSASVFAGQLQAGDSFYSIGGEHVYTSGDVTMLLDRCEGGTADIVVLRGGEKVRLPNAQVERRDFGGEQLYGFTIDVQEKTLGGTLGFSWNSCVDFVRIVRLGLGDLFTGRAGLKDMSGPVGIVEQVTETANQQESAWEGLAVVLYYFSFIAINLGVMNLLPIPALDGGRIGELEYENFNAARAIIRIKGKNVHPGSAKNVMKNAALIGTEIASLLPERETPAKTEGYEGFFHLCSFEGDVTSATLNYIIRDFNADSFAHRKELLRLIVERKNAQYNNCIELDLHDEYYNMLSQIEPHMEIVSLAKQAMLDCGITPIIQPIRGGTDGARLSFMGLPCPNLFAGGHNFHSNYEYVPVPSMEKAVSMIVRIAELAATTLDFQKNV